MTQDFSTLKLKKQYLSTLVADQIQNMIVERLYQVDDRLPSERELAALLGVSRNVVREATKLLEERGLVNVQSGSGVYVAAQESQVFSRSVGIYVKRQQVSIAQIYETRWILEVENARLASMKATDEDITALQSCLEESRHKVVAPDAFTKMDVNFHRLLAVATQNPILPILLETITDALHAQCEITSRLPGAQENALNHHINIFKCVQARDADAAYTAMSEHIKNSWEWLLRAINNSEDEIGEITFPI